MRPSLFSLSVLFLALAAPVFAESRDLSVPLDLEGMKGKIVRVTNLKDSGRGSFRAAVGKEFPRTIVFETSGEIRLERTVDIRNGDVVIAGQTAPEPGITIRGAGLIIHGQNVLLEGLRIRVGDERPDSEPNRDAISILGPLDPKVKGGAGASNVLIRNVSLSWWTDDIGIWYGAKGVTFDRVIFAEALHKSIHSKGPHSKGLLVGPGSEVLVKDCLFTNNADRNPFVKNGAKLVFVNNVVHNWVSSRIATHIGSDDQTKWFPDKDAPSFATVEGNVYISGFNTPSASGGPVAVGVWQGKKGGAGLGTQVYVNDNQVVGEGIRPLQVMTPFDPIAKERPVWVNGLQVRPSQETEAYVLANAGAFPRDSIDRRIVQGVKDRKETTKIIDSQSQVGGWLELPVNRRKFVAPDDNP